MSLLLFLWIFTVINGVQTKESTDTLDHLSTTTDDTTGISEVSTTSDVDIKMTELSKVTTTSEWGIHVTADLLQGTKDGDVKTTTNLSEGTITLDWDIIMTTDFPEPTTSSGRETIIKTKQQNSDITTSNVLDKYTSMENTTTLVQATTKTADPIKQMDPCSFAGKCNFTASMDHQFCKCDKYCTLYNDCCIDANKVQNISKYTPYMNCIKGTSLPNFEGFLAVDSCLETHDNITLTMMCQDDDIVKHGPSVVGPDGTIFRNQYCALCHAINTDDVFHVTFFIPDSKTLDIILKSTSNFSKTAKLEYFFDYVDYKEKAPAHITPRTCMMSTIRNHKKLCQAYINPVYIMRRPFPDFYRNYFCIDETKRHLFNCFGNNYDRIAIGERWRALPISVMFNFVNKKKTNDELVCDTWSQKLDDEGSCQEKERISNFTFTFRLVKLVANKPLPAHYIELIGNMYWLSYEFDSWSAPIDLRYIGSENSSMVLIRDIDIRISTTLFRDEMKKLEERMKNMQWKLHIKDENFENEIVIVKEMIDQPTGEVTVFDIYENMTGIRTNNIRGKLRDPMNKIFHRKEKICDNTFVNVLIGNATAISITCRNRSIIDKDYTTLIKTIMTYVCFSVSVLALILLIILYRKLGMSSTIPGSNLENISISLLMSKVLFMVGIGLSDFRVLCYLIGVLLHYLWLSTFYFMSISVLCIVRTLTKMKSNGHIRKEALKSKKRCLTLSGMIFPILFVCPAVLMDNYGDKYFSSGYGIEPCFPNNFPANLIFFSGPVLVSITINFVCLAKIICTISKVSKEIGHISISTPFTNAKVYIRVLILSGLFWIIGVLAAFVENEWIEFLFTILCGLHGFFISVAALTTKQVASDIRRVLKSSNTST